MFPNTRAKGSSLRSRFLGMLAVLALSLLPSRGDAGPITIPTSLLPGAQYRLAFVTAGERDAMSHDITEYDAFVAAEASIETALTSISWQALASTAAVSARDHTGTGPSNFPGVPIFLLNDVKLVDDYADLWGGWLDVRFNIDQHGNPISANPFTGTSTDGTTGYLPLGERYMSGMLVDVAVGSTSYEDLWIGYFFAPPDYTESFYAISEVLVVPVPEPERMTLLALGIAAFALGRALFRGDADEGRPVSGDIRNRRSGDTRN